RYDNFRESEVREFRWLYQSESWHDRSVAMDRRQDVHRVSQGAGPARAGEVPRLEITMKVASGFPKPDAPAGAPAQCAALVFCHHARAGMRRPRSADSREDGCFKPCSMAS